ncbi:MAG TPA: LLM class flavin-dependent oxidoreductase [Gaiellaceae bacterium]
MPDYGHELQFGIFVTPAAEAAESVVGLSTLADRVGLDLVAIQDHPYPRRFLDAWTLLSFVAARTSRVRLAPDVANLSYEEQEVVEPLARLGFYPGQV